MENKNWFNVFLETFIIQQTFNENCCAKHFLNKNSFKLCQFWKNSWFVLFKSVRSYVCALVPVYNVQCVERWHVHEMDSKIYMTIELNYAALLGRIPGIKWRHYTLLQIFRYQNKFILICLFTCWKLVAWRCLKNIRRF